jgi:hypothetical protein
MQSIWKIFKLKAKHNPILTFVTQPTKPPFIKNPNKCSIPAGN